MDRVSALLAQLRDFFMALPPARRMTFVALTAGVLIGTGGLAWWVQQPQYRVLYNGLGAADAGAVIEYLKTEKIPYRVSDTGGNIEVAAGRLYETRMALAGRGIPQGGGVGFEIFAKQTLGSGSAWDIAFSKDAQQKYIFMADGVNEKVKIIDRQTLQELTTFGDGGRQHGQFYGVHSIAIDSKGNLYTTETYEGKRLQRFVYKGMAPVTKMNQGTTWPGTR